MKDTCGYAIATRLAKIRAEASFAEGRVHLVILSVQDKFIQVEEEARKLWRSISGCKSFI